MRKGYFFNAQSPNRATEIWKAVFDHKKKMFVNVLCPFRKIDASSISPSTTPEKKHAFPSESLQGLHKT